MYSELIVMVFGGVEGPAEDPVENSGKVWRALESSQRGRLLKLMDIALIHRDKQGKSSFQMRWKVFDHSPNNYSRLAGPLAEAIFGISKTDGRRRLTEAGLDPLFIKAVDQALEPGRSAYLIHVPRESQIDTRRYRQILGQLEGDLYHTTFRPQIEEVLLKQNG